MPVSITLTIASRFELDDEIERLIDMLDILDPDPDIEPSLGHSPWDGDPRTVDLEGDGADDEPEFGWTVFESRFNRFSPDTSSAEPSLGSLEGINQEKWSHGGVADLEDEHDGREPCCEDEGAQCDDEGAREEDCCIASDDLGSRWGGSLPGESERITADCAAATDRLRAIMAAQGKRPVDRLHTLGGAIRK